MPLALFPSSDTMTEQLPEVTHAYCPSTEAIYFNNNHLQASMFAVELLTKVVKQLHIGVYFRRSF